MIESQRAATATIRGYIYQFDASTFAILAGEADGRVTVEGVEDFDVASSETETYGQVNQPGSVFRRDAAGVRRDRRHARAGSTYHRQMEQPQQPERTDA